MVATGDGVLRCPVCGDVDRRLWGRAESYELHRCVSCCAVFTHPMPSSDELSRLYTTGRYFQGGGHAGYVTGYEASVRSQRLLHETILDHLGPPESHERLLEVGCAEGHFLDAARKRGWEVCGIELSRSAAVAARSRFSVPVLEGHLEEQTLESSSCSVVVLLDVLEHLPDPAQALRTVARLLRPGGRLVIKTPDIGSANARRLGMRWEQIKPPEHLVYFDAQAMVRMLRACGFDLDQRREVGGTGIVAAIRRSMRRHPSIDCPSIVRALLVMRRARWLAWLLTKTSALLGRQDSMLVFAHRVVDGAGRA
jgi:2-polyprenyl-3-methyl-5-hydroxy-6-metoxy-1,4-benzoquinol methylase